MMFLPMLLRQELPILSIRQTLQTKNILTAENPLKNFQRPEIQNITLKADDGTPLYGKLILPD